MNWIMAKLVKRRTYFARLPDQQQTDFPFRKFFSTFLSMHVVKNVAHFGQTVLPLPWNKVLIFRHNVFALLQMFNAQIFKLTDIAEEVMNKGTKKRMHL